MLLYVKKWIGKAELWPYKLTKENWKALKDKWKRLINDKEWQLERKARFSLTSVSWNFFLYFFVCIFQELNDSMENMSVDLKIYEEESYQVFSHSKKFWIKLLFFFFLAYITENFNHNVSSNL